MAEPTPIAVLTIDARYLPLTSREAERLADEIENTLTMVACELRKGEHRDTLRFEIMSIPEVGHMTPKVGTTP